MKIFCDKEVDAVYIRLAEGAQQCNTVHLSGGISLNIGEGERLVGIEILDASDAMQQAGGLEALGIENLKVQVA